MMWLNQRKLVLIRILLISTTFMLICSGHARADKKLAVFVSIPPQKYFLQQIGKQRVDVQVMVQPGASPATYEPRPRQMAAISRTHIYFAIGVPFEKTRLKKIAAANPGMRVVHTDHGISKIPMAANHIEAEHRRQNEHQYHLCAASVFIEERRADRKRNWRPGHICRSTGF